MVLNSGASTAGTLDLNGQSLTINGINGDNANATLGQVVNNGAGAETLTVGGTNTSSTFNGVIADHSNSGTGTIALTKTGNGTFTVGGTNTYTGATTISQGTLAVNGSLASASTVNVAGNAILSGTGTVNGLTTVASTGIVTAASDGTNNLNLAGGLTFAGTGTINTSNLAQGVGSGAAYVTTTTLTANGAANSITINVTAGTGYANNTDYALVTYTGSILGTGNSAFQLGSVSGLTGRQHASLDFSIANQISLDVTGVSPVWSGYDTLGLTAGNPAGNYNSAWIQQPLSSFTTTNWYTGTVGSPTATGMANTDAVLFDDTALTVPVNLGASSNPAGTNLAVDISNGDVTPSSVVFNNSTATYTITGTNGIAGSTSLTLNGNGQVIINNANTFTGGVNINAGTLTLGNNNALGTTNIVAFGTGSNAALQLNNQSITITGLTGDNTAIVENGGSTGNSVLTVAGSATSEYDGVLVDGGSKTLALATSGTATLILTGANTYSGGTMIGFWQHAETRLEHDDWFDPRRRDRQRFADLQSFEQRDLRQCRDRNRCGDGGDGHCGSHGIPGQYPGQHHGDQRRNPAGRRRHHERHDLQCE